MDITSSFECPLCESKNVIKWGGDYKHSRADIAGVEESLYTLGGYQIRKCVLCDLLFKTPVLTQLQVSEYYEASTADQWGDGDFSFARRADVFEQKVLNFGGYGRVLDVGCSNGAMLASWGTRWDKYGAELSPIAATRAVERGIKIIDIEKGEEGFSEYFDVITVVDVIEHIPNPREFIGRLLKLLKPNGVMLWYTGDHSTPFWKFEKGGYWYCDIPEHVCFYSLESLAFVESHFSLKLLLHERYTHTRDRRRLFRLIQQLFKNAAFMVFSGWRKIFGLNFGIKRSTYPNFASARDHMLVVFSKKSS